MKITKRKPYVKQYSAETGKLLNPITPEKPYVHVPANDRGVIRGSIIILANFATGDYTQHRKVRSCKLMVAGKFPPKKGSRYTTEPITRYK